VNVTELLSQKLHLLLDEGKDKDLFILIEEAVFVLIEQVDEVSSCLDPQ